MRRLKIDVTLSHKQKLYLKCDRYKLNRHMSIKIKTKNKDLKKARGVQL